MKGKKILLGMLCLGGTLSALPSPMGAETTYPLGQQTSADIVINNCILLKVNGKPITVMDVVKKMDLLFYRQYPELVENSAARFQYYGMSWKFVLDSLIDDCLIMADAEEKDVTVTDGDIREELETYFGPDVVLNLDKMGMTIDEAYDLLNTELIVSKMTGMMVRSRALTEIHPKAVRQAYQEWIEKHPPQDHFVYRVVSLRSDDAAESERVADQAIDLLNRQAIPFEELAAHIGSDAVKVSISDAYDRKANEISLAHLAILQTLAIGDHSQ